MNSVGTIFQNTHPFMAGRIKQSADAAETARQRLHATLKVLDDQMGSQPFLAGARPSIADCTLLAALDFAAFAGVELDPAFKNIARWQESFKERPSASA